MDVPTAVEGVISSPAKLVLSILLEKLASCLAPATARKPDMELQDELKVKLLSIDALVDDAELKQLRDPHVRRWLFAVKDAVFDAEDLLAEIDYEITKFQVEAESESQTIIHKVSNLFNDPFIVSKMQQVIDRLENLAREVDIMGLEVTTHSSVGLRSKVSQRLLSSSLVAESVIYGRDDDKEVIFNWLTSETNNHIQLSILSIVGMGGLGKTTLAQLIYNDPRIEEAKYDIKAWVCISDDFDVLTVTKAILEAITKSRDDSGSLEMIDGRLKKTLTGKKFLLVLDDVWYENQEKWRAVRTLLSCGACGSKILVTTRDENVASIMGSNEVHHLKQLQADQCWNVFAKHAFHDDHPQLNGELKEIATKIVEKCKGLPLALTSIGSYLRTNPSISQWRDVLFNNKWGLLLEKDNGIIHALFLSYHRLPSHLKRCFAFCALFPKDYEFNKDDLISMWMAENFLQCPRQSDSLKQVGELYFDDLLSKSFFQQSSRFEKHFVMHDFINDLAKYVFRDEWLMLGIDDPQRIGKYVRHLSFNSSVIWSLPDAKRLRTFITTSTRRWRSEISIHELCSKFKFLHNLSLSHCSNLTEVPDSVGKLKLLRSLDLSNTDIKRLPDSICSLYNLQILKLNSCWRLEELPSNLNKLINLRCLEFSDSKVRRMPVHLEKLKNLQVLSTFCVSRSNEFSIQQLRGLDLCGELSIEELQNTVNPMDALAGNLKNKTHLVKLALKWKSNHNPDSTREDKEVLEYLQPSKYLKDLSIYNYGGTQFPSWLSDNSFSNIVSLLLRDCKYCLILPPFGLLACLKELRIKGLDGIVSIGAEFYGTSSSPFPCLETLYFGNMKEWEEWECKVCFPRLQFLRIEECPKLKELSEQLLHLNKLHISFCESIEASWFERNGHAVSNTSLEELRIYSCPNMNIPKRCCYDSLVKLEIYCSCDLLMTFSLDLFPKLSSLELWRCRNLQMITQEHSHNHLKDVKIQSCPQFELLSKRMDILLPSLTELEIRDCPRVEMLSDGGLPSNLKSVSLSSFKLIASLKGTLGANTCLNTLIIYNADVECFPEEGLLPLSLTSLQISDCPNLKKLDYKGLGNLSSLERLTLFHCPNLQCLPEDGLPKSISSLTIDDCPLLKQRCQKPEGEDWGKIAHIQNLHTG